MTDETAAAPSVLDPRKSAIEQIRESFKQAQANKRKDLPVPGWRGLFITVRALEDHNENAEHFRAAATRPGLKISEREIEAADAIILLSGVGSYIRNPDGTQLDLEAPIGLGLYEVLLAPENPDEHQAARAPQDDQQALSLLIPSTEARVVLAQKIKVWSDSAGAESELELAGE